jgi:hypothetical protein
MGPAKSVTRRGRGRETEKRERQRRTTKKNGKEEAWIDRAGLGSSFFMHGFFPGLAL